MAIRLLITGGAGFIGANLVEYFIEDPRVELIRVIDDLSNGYMENVEPFMAHPRYEFVRGDICDYNTCRQVMRDIHKVSHQAALGSVPRSMENPMRTNEVNVGGTVNILYAAKEAGVERVVLAFSSSTYGDSPELPKVEERIGRPLSPYAVSKYASELYAEVFARVYGLTFIGLRYFNIFGPRQNPNNPYAAVIPIFCKAFLEGISPMIYGDGNTTRDFTYVENALLANDLALFTENRDAFNQVYNVACGEQVSLNQMVAMLRQISGKDIYPTYGPERAGDVRHSQADISKIRRLLGYKPRVYMEEGLRRVYQYYAKTLTASSVLA
ncbi:MAG: SDR family oxidoreductase [Saprospiraceae bacterium]|nr:SDR family oxidoreductase [Saprospiraceae bacterium]MDW8484795.1 SDR family oxidoreductase [Saprospiraceae bacterium]